VLGIGLDESTAIVVQGQEFEVVGASKIAIHDGRIVKGAQERNGGKKKYFFMGPGEKYDLTKLERIGKAGPERAVISRRAFLGGLAAAAVAPGRIGLRAQTSVPRVDAQRLRERIETLSTFGRPAGGAFAMA